MARTSLRALLAGGERMVGTFSLIPCVEVVELIAAAGFDFVVLDMEHGPYDLGSLRIALVAARAGGIAAVVRTPGPDPAVLGSVLDAGCDGVLVPGVSSADEARAIVRACRFVPDGERGAHPYVRAAGYGTTPDWFAEANRGVAVMVMVEGRDGVAACPEILRVPGVDALFLGPVDLSHSLGVPGQPDHPSVREALTGIAGLAAEHGVATAVFAAGGAQARFWSAQGVQLITRGVDTQLIRTGFAQAVADSRPAPAAG